MSVPSALLAAVALSLHGLAQAPCEQVVVQNPLTLDGDFGQSIAFDGNLLAIGMPTVSFSPGFALIYEHTETGLQLQAQLQAPDGKNADLFGWSVALEGSHLMVGRRAAGTLNSQGAVYAYQRQSNGTWLMTQKIANTKPGIWAFGWAMSIDGSRVAIGAKGAAALSPRGRVYIFELENGLWVEKAEVAPSLDDIGDWFGASVALQGDRLAVGAPQNGTGRAYVFDRQANGAWVEQALFTPPVVSPTGDEFGRSVAVDGDTVAVGAIAYDAPYMNAGGVFIYEKQAGSWAFRQLLSPTFNGYTARYGYSLSLLGEELFVGAPTDGNPILSSGYVHRYQRIQGVWQETAKFEGSAPFASRWFGSGIVRFGDELVITAPAANSPGPGKVHIYSLVPSTHLEGSNSQVSTGAGGTQPLQLAACGEHAGDFYLLLGSLSGTAPALPLGPLDLPLVFDAYTQFTLAFPNSSWLPGSLGQLDPWGRANASLVLLPGSAPSFVGQTAHHAFVVFDQQSLALETVSNPTPVLLAP